MMKNTTRLLVVGFAGFLLASCTSERMLQRCPSAGVLAEASSLTAFTPGATPAPESEIYRIDARRITTDCVTDEDTRRAESDLDIQFRARRAQGGPAAQYSVPYFIAVNGTDGKVISKKLYNLSFSFAEGQTTSDFSHEVEPAVIQVAPERQALEYQILAGFQLTREQLEYNRVKNRFAE